MKFLALYRLASGSTGVKNKNIKIINNRHLIDYTIERAKKSKFITDIVASTDPFIILIYLKKKSLDTRIKTKKIIN